MAALLPASDYTGKPASAVPASFYSGVAARFNLMRGLDGVRLEVAADGGLVARLGSDEYQYRPITICEPSIINGQLTALVFKKVRAFCSLPDGDAVPVPVSAFTDPDSVVPVFVDNTLTALQFGKASAIAAGGTEGITEVPVVEGACTQVAP